MNHLIYFWQLKDATYVSLRSYESYHFQNLKLAVLLVSMVHENSVVGIS